MAVSIPPITTSKIVKAQYLSDECIQTIEEELKSKRYDTLHKALQVLHKTGDDFASKYPLQSRKVVCLMRTASKQHSNIPSRLITKVMVDFATEGLFKNNIDKTPVQCLDGQVFIDKTIFSLMNPICANELAQTKTLDFSKLTVKSALLLKFLFYRRQDKEELLDRVQFLEMYKILSKYGEHRLRWGLIDRVPFFNTEFLSFVESYEMLPQHRSYLQRKALQVILDEEHGIKSRWFLDNLLLDAKHLYLLEQETPLANCLKKYVNGILLLDEDDTKYLEFLPLLDPAIARNLKVMDAKVPFTAKSLHFLSESFPKTQMRMLGETFKYDFKEMGSKKRDFDTKVVEISAALRAATVKEKLTAWVKNGDEFAAFLKVILNNGLNLENSTKESTNELYMIELTNELDQFLMAQTRTLSWKGSLIFLRNRLLVPDFDVKTFERRVSKIFNVKLLDLSDVHVPSIDSKPLYQILRYRG